jgi:hypothetical protein
MPAIAGIATHDRFGAGGSSGGAPPAPEIS